MRQGVPPLPGVRSLVPIEVIIQHDNDIVIFLGMIGNNSACYFHLRFNSYFPVSLLRSSIII